MKQQPRTTSATLQTPAPWRRLRITASRTTGTLVARYADAAGHPPHARRRVREARQSLTRVSTMNRCSHPTLTSSITSLPWTGRTCETSRAYSNEETRTRKLRLCCLASTREGAGQRSWRIRTTAAARASPRPTSSARASPATSCRTSSLTSTRRREEEEVRGRPRTLAQ